MLTVSSMPAGDRGGSGDTVGCSPSVACTARTDVAAAGDDRVEEFDSIDCDGKGACGASAGPAERLGEVQSASVPGDAKLGSADLAVDVTLPWPDLPEFCAGLRVEQATADPGV